MIDWFPAPKQAYLKVNIRSKLIPTDETKMIASLLESWERLFITTQ